MALLGNQARVVSFCFCPEFLLISVAASVRLVPWLSCCSFLGLLPSCWFFSLLSSRSLRQALPIVAVLHILTVVGLEFAGLEWKDCRTKKSLCGEHKLKAEPFQLVSSSQLLQGANLQGVITSPECSASCPSATAYFTTGPCQLKLKSCLNELEGTLQLSLNPSRR